MIDKISLRTVYLNLRMDNRSGWIFKFKDTYIHCENSFSVSCDTSEWNVGKELIDEMIEYFSKSPYDRFELFDYGYTSGKRSGDVWVNIREKK